MVLYTFAITLTKLVPTQMMQMLQDSESTTINLTCSLIEKRLTGSPIPNISFNRSFTIIEHYPLDNLTSMQPLKYRHIRGGNFDPFNYLCGLFCVVFYHKQFKCVSCFFFSFCRKENGSNGLNKLKVVQCIFPIKTPKSLDFHSLRLL